MAKQVINLGTAPSGAGGDDRRSAWIKAIANFDELYSFIAMAYQKGNVVGTVSQSAGTPTGALFQKGSNANGEYVRLADGTQICWGFISLPAASMLGTATGTATFPAVFSVAPKVIYSPDGAVGTGSQADVGAAAYNGTYTSITNSGWALYSYIYRLATIFPVRFSYIAIGRWY
ncbi:hypothetical protein [Pseudomonas sp. zjy_11]|uniref:hypothetical protein n=1 Tax=unclassified Pseudomonas TaxID=196821 RepID=UPI00370A12B6